MNDKGDIMSEEIKNEDVVEETPIILATLQEGEPLITADMAEKFEAIKEEIFAEKVEEAVEEPTVEEPKPAEAEEPKNVISSGSQRTGKKADEVAGITAVENGVIGTGTVKPKPKNVVKQQDKPEVEKVAIYSSKNVTWTGVGKVYRGYNIVTKEAADKWLTRDHARVATPEELAKEFGR
jgi:DNA-binding protein H-NS